MHYSKIDPMSIVDGVGCRVTLFVSGCRNHCEECFNPETWNFNYGEEFTPIQENEIIELCKKPYIAGLTILGGEPFEEENQLALLPFIQKFKKACPDKNLWMFTGYVWDKDLIEGGRKFKAGVTDKILEQVDVLVDGPYVKELRDLSLDFRGSSNQRLLMKEENMKFVSRLHNNK